MPDGMTKEDMQAAADGDLRNSIIGSPAARLFSVDRSWSVRCGPCSGAQYRGVVAPETFNTAYVPVVCAAGVGTLGTFDYTLFLQGQGLNSSNSTGTSLGALTGTPTSRDTSQWGDALGLDGDRYQVNGIRASLGSPFTVASTTLDATRVGVNMSAEDLKRLRRLIASNVALYIIRGANDCDHPLGIIDGLRIGPEDDDASGNRVDQPVYLSDPMNFTAKEGGRAENANIKVQSPGAASVAFDAFAAGATIYVPVRVYLTILRPAGSTVCGT